jgi:hypothetical protein
MLILGIIISLGAALAFAAIGVLIINGIQHTLRTRFVKRMRIMNTPTPIQWGSIVYVIVVAALPTTLTLLTAWQLVALVQRLGN